MMRLKNDFLSKVNSLEPKGISKDAKSNLHIVYTPLNGSGLKYVSKALSDSGFDNISIVKSQEKPDSNFPTCKSPNPEKMSAYTEAFETLDECKADIIIATDPDCDRIGMRACK